MPIPVIVFDGQGRTYSFAAVSSALAGANLWLLKSITGVGGSKVELDYGVTTPAVPGVSTLAIDLLRVSYSPSAAAAGCYKHSVALSYDGDAAAPLSMSVLGDRISAAKAQAGRSRRIQQSQLWQLLCAPAGLSAPIRIAGCGHPAEPLAGTLSYGLQCRNPCQTCSSAVSLGISEDCPLWTFQAVRASN